MGMEQWLERLPRFDTGPGSRLSKVVVTYRAQSHIFNSKFKSCGTPVSHLMIIWFYRFQNIWNPFLERKQNSFTCLSSYRELRERALGVTCAFSLLLVLVLAPGFFSRPSNWLPFRVSKLTFQALALPFETLIGGQFTLSTQLIKSNYFIIPLLSPPPPHQSITFFTNLPPLFICKIFPGVNSQFSYWRFTPPPFPPKTSYRRLRAASRVYLPLQPPITSSSASHW